MGQYNINFICNIRFSLHDLYIFISIYLQTEVYILLYISLFTFISHFILHFYLQLYDSFIVTYLFFYHGDQICSSLTGLSLRERIIGAWFGLI